MADNETANSFRTIGWNGITLLCPHQWEFRVQDKSHIVIEHDFTPILQLKWAHEQPKNRFTSSLQSTDNEPEYSLKTQLTKQLASRYQVYRIPSEQPGIIEAMLVCNHCGTTIHLQLLPAAHKVRNQCNRMLAGLSCHRDDGNRLWSLQDTSFEVPADLALHKSLFKAGLCWLQFRHRATEVQLVRLAPADKRLSLQSAAEILVELCAAKGLTVRNHSAASATFVARTPTLWQQLRYRLKRERPFIEAGLRHLIDKNVLAGCIISAKEPIAPQAARNLLPTQ